METEWLKDVIEDARHEHSLDKSAEDAGTQVLPEDGEGVEDESAKPAEEDSTQAGAPEGDSAKGAGDESDGGKSDDEKQDGAPPPARDKEPDSRIADMEKQIENLHKRLHDNQSAYHDEHRQLLELRKELDALRSRSGKEEPDSDDWFAESDDDDKKKEDGVPQAEKLKLEQLEQEVRALKNQEVQAKWEAAEAPVKDKHPDYDQMVYEVLAPEYEKNPALKERFQELGATPEAAYQLARELYLIRNPDKLKEQVIEELNQNKNSGQAKPQNPPRILSQNSRSPGRDKGVAFNRERDLLDRALPKIR